MNLTTILRPPGTGRRQADPMQRQAAELSRANRRIIRLEKQLDTTETELDVAEETNERLTCALAEANATIAARDQRHAQDEKQLRHMAGQVVRAQAEQERLRQAVINARPRITVAEAPLVPPYAAIALPYPVPVQAPDDPNATTQTLPILGANWAAA